MGKRKKRKASRGRREKLREEEEEKLREEEEESFARKRRKSEIGAGEPQFKAVSTPWWVGNRWDDWYCDFAASGVEVGLRFKKIPDALTHNYWSLQDCDITI